ncbi:MAG: hypothetical protein HOH65_08245 [Rhodospirillaceae bacterium]|nr:hypothetical protein [Rhodospirillaceae bacterium]
MPFQFSSCQALLPQVGALYGPYTELFGEYILQAHMTFERLGLRPYVSRDMAALEHFSDTVSTPLLSTFNPNICMFPEQNGLWIAVLDRDDKIVACQADRLVLIMPGTLEEDLTSLRLFYDDPDSSAAEGEHLTLSEPARGLAASIAGRIAYAGRLYVDSAWRGHGIGQVLSLLGHALSSAWWFPDHIVTLVRQEVRVTKPGGKFDYPRKERGISWMQPDYPGTSDLWLYAKTPEDVAEQLEGAMRPTEHRARSAA